VSLTLSALLSLHVELPIAFGVRFLRECSADQGVLHSFPTRRSSDLQVRGALGDERGQFRGDLRRDDAFGIDFEVAGADVELVADLEGRLLAGDRRLLEVDGALEGGGRRELVRGGSA